MSFAKPLACAMALAVVCWGPPKRVLAQSVVTPPTTHPIFVSADEAALNDEAQSRFRQAAKRLGLGPVETVDAPPLPKAQAPAALAQGMAHVRELAFDEGLEPLMRAVAEVKETAAAGVSQEQLCDLLLYLAMAQDKADWRELPPEGPEPARPEAAEAYLQAATLCPQRELYVRTFPPLARHRFAQAVERVRSRGEGVLEVKAPTDALISIDARPLTPAPARATLPFGDHFIRVERPGRLPWAATVPLSLSRLEVETGPQPLRSFPDAEAVIHARRMAAAYALVAELQPGDDPLLEMRLVEVATGARIDSTRVPLQDEAGGVQAAAMRLDEQARRRELLEQTGASTGHDAGLHITSAPVKPRLDGGPGPTEDPRGWAARRWPVLTAVGALVVTSLVLGLVVALDEKNAVE